MRDPSCISNEDYIQIIIADGEDSFHNDALETIEVYFGKTSDFKVKIRTLFSILSQEEKTRAERFKIFSIRDTYIVCHGILRQLLAERLNREAAAISIDIDVYGKPVLGDQAIHFNISHSKDVFAIALSDSAEIGVDIEKIDRDMKYEGIIQSYFHPNEISSIDSAGTKMEKINLFYKYWTRKEAFLKAVGVGLINELNKFDTSTDFNMELEKYFPHDLLLKGKVYHIYSVTHNDFALSYASLMPIGCNCMLIK